MSGAWVSAEPATDLTAAGVFGSDNSLDAFVATFSLVFSLLAITYFPLVGEPRSTSELMFSLSTSMRRMSGGGNWLFVTLCVL